MQSSSSRIGFLAPTSIVSRRPCHTGAVSRSRPTFVCVVDAERKAVAPKTYRIIRDDERNKVPLPPIHYTVPVIGYVLDRIFNNREQLKQRYGDIFHSNGRFNITDYNTIREMLSDWRTFASVESSPVSKDIFGKASMILLDGQEHSDLRTSFAPAFSPKLFPAYFELIQRRASKKWADLEKQSKSGKTIYLDPTFRELYLAVIIEMTTGLTSDDEYYSKILELNSRMFFAFVSPPFGPLYDDAIKAKRELVEIISGVVQRAAIENAAIVDKLRSYGDELFALRAKEIRDTKANILCMLLSGDKNVRTGVENDPIVFETLANHILGLWFAGYLTSGATSSCASFEILRNPEILTNLRAEQEQLITDADGVRQVQYSQLSKMSLLESLINEILRFHPVADGVLRICTEDVEAFGRRIEKGATVFFDYAVAMQDDEYYEDAKVFKWHRFVKQKGKPIPPKVLTFTPPGTPHYCLGAQLSFLLMKTTFAEMLRNYDFKLDPNASSEYSRVPQDVPASKVPVSEIRSRFVN